MDARSDDAYNDLELQGSQRMSDHPRRRFLKASAGVVSGLALGACADESSAPVPQASGLDRQMLEAVGRLVLPRSAIGADGISRAIDNFLAWLDGFEPVSERDHPYESGDITYGPPDPAPLWGAQLDALTIEATRRFQTAYKDLDEDRQREILLRQLPENLPADMPYAGAASHVAIGLIAWFYSTPEATDLALQAKVGRYLCRGFGGAGERPVPLED